MSESDGSAVLSAQSRAVGSNRGDGQDVDSRIIRGFLLSYPPDQLTSAHLGVKLRITTIKRAENLFSSFGMLSDEQLRPPKCSWRIHRGPWINIVPFNCLPICTEHLQRSSTHTPSWSQLDAEQKMGSMCRFPFGKKLWKWTKRTQPPSFLFFLSPDICMFNLQLVHLPGNHRKVI